ncbi:MAG: hypothetical protein L6R37_004297 [Teloschistes peruensis]|nr:MAG: hypothetical protein L6R37_004297 [Teloschistes peruensis]
MAGNQSEAGRIISEAAQAEGAPGGPAKGSQSAQMQSELTRQRNFQRNFEKIAANVASKLVDAPDSITKEDAQAIHRAETRTSGGQRPQSGNLSSQVQHQASVNQGATSTSNTSASLDSTTQSQLDRQANFEDVAAKVGDKLASAPESISKEDADTLHSREHRAFGQTEKGGLAAQAQHQVSEPS